MLGIYCLNKSSVIANEEFRHKSEIAHLNFVVLSYMLLVGWLDGCVLQLCYFVLKIYSHLKIIQLISPDTPLDILFYTKSPLLDLIWTKVTRLEYIQNNSTLAITGPKTVASTEELYDEKGLESLDKKMVQETARLV